MKKSLRTDAFGQALEFGKHMDEEIRHTQDHASSYWALHSGQCCSSSAGAPEDDPKAAPTATRHYQRAKTELLMR